jgi:hypothetical protein
LITPLTVPAKNVLISRSPIIHKVYNCQYTLYTVYYIAYTHIKNCYSYTMAVDCVNCFQYTGTCPAYSPLPGNVRSLRTSNTTREFHSKVIVNQDMRIYINICTMLHVTLTNIYCKGFAIVHFLSFILFIIFTLFLISFTLQFHFEHT